MQVSEFGVGSSGNPGFNIFYYNRKTFEILDLEYWWVDLQTANEYPDRAPIWTKRYSAKDVYQLNDFSAESWNEVETKIKNNKTMSELNQIIWSKGLLY